MKKMKDEKKLIHPSFFFQNMAVIPYRHYIRELYKDRPTIAVTNGQSAALMIFDDFEEMHNVFDVSLKRISRKQQTHSLKELADVAIPELRDYFKSDYIADKVCYVTQCWQQKGTTKKFLKALENVLVTKLRNGRTQNLFEVYVASESFDIDYAIVDVHK
jgi:hypothetical protein